MPDLPAVTVYIECLDRRLRGERLERARLVSFFVVRTAKPSLRDLEGKRIRGFRRMGKRLVWEFEDDLSLVLHLMVAGRLRWRDAGAISPGRIGLAAFDFACGTVLLTEAGTKKRASIHVVRGEEAVRALDPGGRELDAIDAAEFLVRAGASKRARETHFTFGNVFPLSTLPVDSSKRSAFLLPVAELPVTVWPEPPRATP